MDPGVLADLGDKRVDQGPARRLGVDRGEMGLGQHFAHQLGGPAGVDQVVDDQRIGAVAGHALEHRDFTLCLMVVGRHADGVDQPQFQLARDDRRRHQPAARDRDNLIPRSLFRQSPGERLGVTMELFPGNGEVVLRLGGHENYYARRRAAPPSCGAKEIVPH